MGRRKKTDIEYNDITQLKTLNNRHKAVKIILNNIIEVIKGSIEAEKKLKKIEDILRNEKCI